jgi:hypothetical protein
MAEPVIIEGEWRAQSRSHFQFFVQDHCLIDYRPGILFGSGQFQIKDRPCRILHRFVRNTLICETTRHKLGVASLDFFGWHIDIPGRPRIQVGHYRLWNEKNGMSEMVFEVSQGRFPLEKVKVRMLERPDVLVLSALAFETIRRITHVDVAGA